MRVVATLVANSRKFSESSAGYIVWTARYGHRLSAPVAASLWEACTSPAGRRLQFETAALLPPDLSLRLVRPAKLYPSMDADGE
jgi:hypothetical protein